MNRREFLGTALAVSAAFPTSGFATAVGGSTEHRQPRPRFAPHFGMFRHHAGDDPADQLHFMAQHGFRAFEDLALATRPATILGRIQQAAERFDLETGVFMATADFSAPTFAAGCNDLSARVLAEVHSAVELARRLNARYCAVVPGKADSRLPQARQTAHALELLKRCVALCEPAGVVLLLEPIPHRPRCPEMLLASVSQAFEWCRTIASPACKILLDVPQLYATTPDPLRFLDQGWSEVGYIQIGDHPGRKEPGTGVIDFPTLIAFLRNKAYGGILGMEHGNSLAGLPGERAVLDAYAALSGLVAPPLRGTSLGPTAAHRL